MSTFRSLGVLAACALYQQAQAVPITFEFEAVVDSTRGTLAAPCLEKSFRAITRSRAQPRDRVTRSRRSVLPMACASICHPARFLSMDSSGFKSARRARTSSSQISNETTIGLDIQTNLSDASLPLVPPPLVGNSTISMNSFGGTACVLRGHLTSLVARPRGNGLYDSFSGEFIDPRLWNNSLPCTSSHTFECVRELRGDKLQLGLRTYGSSSTDIGTNDDAVGLGLPKWEPDNDDRERRHRERRRRRGLPRKPGSFSGGREDSRDLLQHRGSVSRTAADSRQCRDHDFGALRPAARTARRHGVCKHRHPVCSPRSERVIGRSGPRQDLGRRKGSRRPPLGSRARQIRVQARARGFLVCCRDDCLYVAGSQSATGSGVQAARNAYRRRELRERFVGREHQGELLRRAAQPGSTAVARERVGTIEALIELTRPSVPRPGLAPGFFLRTAERPVAFSLRR